MRSPFRRRQHDDAKRYVVYVLWMIGHSQRSIAKAVRLRPKQVAGIIDNSGEYRDRASMSDEEREIRLAELAAIRVEDGVKLDGGALDRIPFRTRPLDGRQYRGALARKVRRGP